LSEIHQAAVSGAEPGASCWRSTPAPTKITPGETLPVQALSPMLARAAESRPMTAAMAAQFRHGHLLPFVQQGAFDRECHPQQAHVLPDVAH
jgi:hypothetical protein